jgi:hypothetical protein
MYDSNVTLTVIRYGIIFTKKYTSVYDAAKSACYDISRGISAPISIECNGDMVWKHILGSDHQYTLLDELAGIAIGKFYTDVYDD